ncbi:MAG: response regulator [Phycisphaerales bacterium]
MDISEKVLEAFQIEHAEHLELIRVCLQQLATEGASSRAKLIEQAFRTAHTLKGGARICGLTDVEAIAHALESFFAHLRDERSGLDEEASRRVAHAIDAIEDRMAAIAGNGQGPDLGEVIADVRRLAGEEESPPSAPRASQSRAPDAATHKPVAVDAPVVEAPPAPSDARVGDDAAGEPAESGATPTSSDRRLDTMRVRAENLDRLLRSADVLVSRCAASTGAEAEDASLCDRLSRLQRDLVTARRALGRGAGGNATHAATESLRHLERELEALIREAQRTRTRRRAGAWELSSVGRELQDHIRDVRMIPGESVFQGLRKMARDLARESGKEIDLRCEGLDARADRLVLQALKAPLMHLLRNAIAHGAESPEQRVAAGKPACASIILTMHVDANRMTLSVTDDGRGLDEARIREAARRAGILEEGEDVDDDDIARIILHPGLTTATRVDEVSGRGVGLTDVHETVRNLQGDLHIRSTPGKGTTFEISAPISISTHRVLVVEAGGQRFALPVHAIRRLLKVKRLDLQSIEGRTVIPVDGRPAPVLDLATLVGVRTEPPRGEGELNLVVLRSARASLAVIVDEFLDERAALVKPMPNGIRWTPLLGGGIVLDDGSVCLVLNPGELLSQDHAPSAAPTPFSGDVVDASTLTILIVDDSLTTRTLEKSLLETEGFKVRIAVDGVEALETLREAPVDLVISDIEMPRLDGFGLLERIKSDPSLARIPVIIVSSMKREEHLERGMALGADAYIVKQRFDHEELLSAIHQFI